MLSYTTPAGPYPSALEGSRLSPLAHFPPVLSAAALTNRTPQAIRQRPRCRNMRICLLLRRHRTLQAPAYNEWQRQQQAKENLNQPVGLFKDMVHSWPQRAPGMEVEVKAMNQSALPPFVFPDGTVDQAPSVQRQETGARKVETWPLTCANMVTPTCQNDYCRLRGCLAEGRVRAGRQVS